MLSRIVYTPALEKKSRAYAARKRRRGLCAALTAAALTVLIGSGVVLLRHPGVQIKVIAIAGLEAVPEEEIRTLANKMLADSYAFVVPRSSFFLTRPRTFAAALEREIPRIRTAAAVKEFPDTLRISVVERSTWGIACGGEASSEFGDASPASGVQRSEHSSGAQRPTPNAQSSTDSRFSTPACVYIDETGFAFESAPRSSGSLITKVRSDGPPATVGTHAVETGLMEHLRFLGQEIERVAGTRAVEYRLLSEVPSEIRVVTEQGVELIFRRDDDFANAFRVLDRVLSQEIREKRSRLDYIDLRFGNKVFYKVR